MSNKASMNRVKLKVRYNALLLKEFTIADMVRVTGLNPESVRTEVQRMKKEGLIISKPTSIKRTSRGGRICIYELTKDPKVRLTLLESIEGFYPPSEGERPTSRFFSSAKQLIDQAMTLEEILRKRLLSQADYELDMAQKAEGDNLAPKSVNAYLEIQRARVFYHNNKFKKAQKHFYMILDEYAGVLNEEDKKYIEEYILCAGLFCQISPQIMAKAKDAQIARDLLDELDKNLYNSDRPLISLLLYLVGKLSQSAYGELLDTLIPSLNASLARVEASQSRVEASQLRIETNQHEVKTKIKDLEQAPYQRQKSRLIVQKTQFTDYESYQDSMMSQVWQDSLLSKATKKN